MYADPRTWTEFAEAFAFLGNSLLAPMSQTSEMGIDPVFWRAFPDFEDDDVAKAIGRCLDYADIKQAMAGEDVDPVLDISVEYTRLFVGPPSPAAAPWETFYRNEGVSVGFGEATFDMQRLLREAGLQVSNENNQYADHIGIELLYLSVLCERAAQGDQTQAGQTQAGQTQADACASFAAAHPLSWVGKLRQRVAADSPSGYYDNLLLLAEALLGKVAR